MSKMNIRVREINNISIMDLEGRIDINSSEIIETIGWLMKNRKKDILLNFTGVDMVDYSGISILAIAYKNVMNHKGKMGFCNVALHISELFRIVRLDSVFEIYENEEAALQRFHFESPLDKKMLRRRFKRLDLHSEAEFCLKQSAQVNPIWHTGKILNLSGEGLFIYTKKLLPLGKEIKLRLDLQERKPLEVEGKIIWIADKSIQPQSYPGMGVFFTKLAKRNQDKMLRFINKRAIQRSAS